MLVQLLIEGIYGFKVVLISSKKTLRSTLFGRILCTYIPCVYLPLRQAQEDEKQVCWGQEGCVSWYIHLDVRCIHISTRGPSLSIWSHNNSSWSVMIHIRPWRHTIDRQHRQNASLTHCSPALRSILRHGLMGGMQPSFSTTIPLTWTTSALFTRERMAACKFCFLALFF
jgi:hypothetical protein